MSRLALATRSVTTLVRVLQFLIAVLILGIFSYFLAYLTKHHIHIPQYEKAVEGIAGAAVIYTAFAVILTCFLGGITFFAFLALVLDICFCGCFIAIAVMTRAGAHSCNSNSNDSPIGLGQHASCQLRRAVFAVAIAGTLLFLISAVLQVLLSRAHKKEKRYGPSPSNNYTSGSGGRRKFWARKNHKNRDAELATVGAAGGLAGVEHNKHHNHDSTNVNGGMHDSTMTGTAVEDGYGGSANKYATKEPTLPGQQQQVHGYANQGTGYQSTGYTPQTSGVIGGGAGTSMPEMPGNTHTEGHTHAGPGLLNEHKHGY